MDDLISRQAAIDALDGEIEITGRTNAEAVKGYVRLVKDRLERLPSEQPEPSTEIQEILNYLDTTLHPIVSPDNWYAYAELYDMVSSLPTAQHWVPCSERLPKKEEWHYWVCTDTGYQCQCRWTNDVYGFGASDRWEWKIFDIPQYQKVVAWMPLPEPYREGEQNE